MPHNFYFERLDAQVRQNKGHVFDDSGRCKRCGIQEDRWREEQGRCPGKQQEHDIHSE